MGKASAPVCNIPLEKGLEIELGIVYVQLRGRWSVACEAPELAALRVFAASTSNKAVAAIPTSRPHFRAIIAIFSIDFNRLQ